MLNAGSIQNQHQQHHNHHLQQQQPHIHHNQHHNQQQQQQQQHHQHQHQHNHHSHQQDATQQSQHNHHNHHIPYQNQYHTVSPQNEYAHHQKTNLDNSQLIDQAPLHQNHPKPNHPLPHHVQNQHLLQPLQPNTSDSLDNLLGSIRLSPLTSEAERQDYGSYGPASHPIHAPQSSPPGISPDPRGYMADTQPHQVHQRNDADNQDASGKSSEEERRLSPVFQERGSSSSSVDAQSSSPPNMTHHDSICNHLYEIGFLSGLFADVTLHVPELEGVGKAYNLHSLMLARSPYLFNLLKHAAPSREITVHFDNHYVNEDGLAIALGHLYAGYSQELVNPTNATAVFEASKLLGLDDLARIAVDEMRNDINRETLLSYVRFVDEAWSRNSPAPSSVESANHRSQTRESNTGSFCDGMKLISEACFAYLADELLRELDDDAQRSLSIVPRRRASRAFIETLSRRSASQDADSNNSSSDRDPTPYCTREEANALFVRLPFPWLKAVMESIHFCITSDMKRYHFIQSIIALRERSRLEKIARRELEEGGEESVVLSFGRPGADGRNVTLVRKPLKSARPKERVLWKAPVC